MYIIQFISEDTIISEVYIKNLHLLMFELLEITTFIEIF